MGTATIAKSFVVSCITAAAVLVASPTSAELLYAAPAANDVNGALFFFDNESTAFPDFAFIQCDDDGRPGKIMYIEQLDDGNFYAAAGCWGLRPGGIAVEWQKPEDISTDTAEIPDEVIVTCAEGSEAAQRCLRLDS